MKMIAAMREGNREQVFSGQCILITGGTTAPGLASAKLLARHGALILISAANDRELEAALREIREQVPRCSVIGVRADLTTPEGVDSFFLTARMAFPKIDLIIHIPVLPAGEDPGGNEKVYRACVAKANGLARNGKTAAIAQIRRKNSVQV